VDFRWSALAAVRRHRVFWTHMVRRKSLSGPRDSAGVSLSMEGLAMSLEHSPGRYSDFDSVRIIRDGDMPDIIGTSRSSWLRMKQGGDCPPAIRLSVRQVGYRLSDVKVWLDKKQGA
jgi:predicted DNA-binding transcriptional regulator AlpA